jgi:probable HAF family extracellular repeat protein
LGLSTLFNIIKRKDQMSAKSSYLALVAAGALLLVAGHSQAHPFPGFNYTDLGALSGGGDSFSTSVNNSGQVAGFSSVAGGYRNATLWDETLRKLPGGGDYSEGWGINDRGQVAGISWSSTNDDLTRATVWDGSMAMNLGMVPGADASHARAINNSGQVAGWATTDGSSRATIWNGTTATQLGAVPGADASYGRAINNHGQVAGWSTTDGNSHATLWNGATATDLGTLPEGNASAALAINDKGQVAGRSTFLPGSFAYHATLWDGSKATDLSTLGGDYSEARAINEAGLVVGWSDTRDDQTSATLWSGTEVIDLNIYLDQSRVNAGWVLTAADDINDQGWIVGSAYNNLTQQTHGFLMAPIPEPDTYGMLLAGLGLMATVVSRSRRRMTALTSAK